MLAIAAPAPNPPAVPSAPPTTVPKAGPIPGCSVSDSGTEASWSSGAAGAKMLILSLLTPLVRTRSMPLFASALVLNTPTSGVMGVLLVAEMTYGYKQQLPYHLRMLNEIRK